MDSTTHNIRAFDFDEDADELQEPDDPQDADVLSFSISLDGKLSGLSYREYKECDSDGEVRQMHEPRNQDKLHSTIEAAFRAVGFEEVHVRSSGHQRHWDHDVSYRIRTLIPDEFDLALSGAKQERSRRRSRRLF